MNKRLVTIGLLVTALLAVGIGLAFRSVVSAVAAAEGGRGALARLEQALNAGEAGPHTAAAGDAAFTVAVAGPDGAAGAVEAGPGIVVTGIVPDSPAAKAGIVRGDIVLSVDGVDVTGMVDLHRAMADANAGDAVRLEVQHGDDVRDVEVVLADGGPARLGVVGCGGGMPARIALHAMGGGPAVVAAVTADSPAAAAGLAAGDRITAVDGERLGGGALVFRHGGARDGHGGLHRFFGQLFGADDDGAAPDAGADDAAAPDAAPAAPAADVLVPAPDAVAPQVAPLPDGPLDEVVATVGSTAGGPSLAEAIARHAPGDTVTLTVERDGEAARDVEVTLGAHPDDPTKAFLGVRYAGGFGGAMHAVPALPLPGGPLGGDPELRERLAALPEGTGGAIVGAVVPGGAAAAAGVSVHDIVTAIDGAPLDGPRALAEAVGQRKPGDTVRLTVVRDAAEPRELTVTLGTHPDDPAKGYLGLTTTGYFRHDGGALGDTLFDWFIGPDGADGPSLDGDVMPAVPAIPAVPAQPGATFELEVDAPPSDNV